MALGMPQTSSVPRLHLLLALAVMAVWGDEFRCHQIGADALAALVACHLALCLCVLAGGVVPETAGGALVQSGGLWRADRCRAIWPAFSGHEERHYTGPRFAGGANTGVFHHCLINAVDG